MMQAPFQRPNHLEEALQHTSLTGEVAASLFDRPLLKNVVLGCCVNP